MYFRKWNMQGKIKVAHVITRLDSGGSAQNTILTLLGLGDSRYRLAMIKGESIESEMGDEERGQVKSSLSRIRKKGIPDFTYSCLIRRINPLLDLRCLIRLFFFFRKERPFIVHTHTSKAGFLGRLSAWLARVPVIVHTPHGHIFWGYYGPLITELFINMERLIAKITDKIICLTEQEKRDHIQFRIERPEKFVTIHSGIDFPVFQKSSFLHGRLRDELGIPNGEPVIGTVGRLVPIKGHEYMIRAFALLMNEFENSWLILVGDGFLGTYLKRLSRELGVSERVVFAGWRFNVSDFLSFFDIFVFPSLNEGMGRALVEAMAAGKPIVASNVGGISDLVKDRQNGLLFRPGDIDGMAMAMKRLLNNQEMMIDMGKMGRIMAENYSVEKMVKRIDDLYFSLCQRRISV